jgi:hypothetical protein
VLWGMAACSMPRVHEEAPPNYTLAGVWELNPALSTDSEKALASLQPKPRTRKGAPPPPSSQPAPEVINDPTTDLPPIDITSGGRYSAGDVYLTRDQRERMQYRPPLDFQTNELLGGQWLKIQQTDSEMRIANAARSRSYTAGERSVVSVPSGVADQVSGWKGRSYMIYLSPQVGPRVQESYTLSSDGRQLVVKISVDSEGKNEAIKVIRTYDRSNRDPAQLRQTLQETLPPTH